MLQVIKQLIINAAHIYEAHHNLGLERYAQSELGG